MTLYSSWQNFVMHPNNPDRAALGLPVRSLDHASEPGALVVTERSIIEEGDQFVAMAVGEYNDVAVWTAKCAYQLYEAHHAGKEILLKAERSPPPAASRQWVNFVVHPLNPERVQTRADRLRVEGALSTPKKGEVLGENHPRAFVVKEGEFPTQFEKFVGIHFDEAGGVTIWTERFVIVLERTLMERFVMMLRDPGES